MSCGPLNALLTSSIDCTINGPFLFGEFKNTLNKFISITLIADNTIDTPLTGLLTSSLQCDNSILYFGEDKTIRSYGFNLNAELSSSMPLEACLFPE